MTTLRRDRLVLGDVITYRCYFAPLARASFIDDPPGARSLLTLAYSCLDLQRSQPTYMYQSDTGKADWPAPHLAHRARSPASISRVSAISPQRSSCGRACIARSFANGSGTRRLESRSTSIRTPCPRCSKRPQTRSTRLCEGGRPDTCGRRRVFPASCNLPIRRSPTRAGRRV